MTDISATTAPKSDQLNFDDFIGDKPMTIKITKVSLVAGDQPVILNYEGDNGHPYKPGKSMRRVLVHVWGKDGNAYVGRSLTLYGDPKVVFGGMAVGGIRISHMSHIDAPVTMALTTTRSKRAPFTVKPLAAQSDSAPAHITRDQQKEIIAAMGAEVKPADLLAHFSVKTSGDILVSQFADVLAWVNAQKSTSDPASKSTCPNCDALLNSAGECSECGAA